jgi:pimeloyl-ACP methyl ester carboxylesterase
MSQTLRTLRQTVGAPTLIVMLPGAYMTPEDYEAQGFFNAIARRQLVVDLVAVDLDLGAISAGTALPALQAEILQPARAQGYKKIWLGGISLGGLLALCHNADQPGGIDGLVCWRPTRVAD